MTLVPLDLRVLEPMRALGDDPDVIRFTYLSPPFGPDEAAAWIGKYIEGWTDGTRAGFSVHGPQGEFLGMASIIKLELDARQGEIGYMLAPTARGRGIATAAVKLLTEWAFDELGLVRLELRIDDSNEGSIAVATRAGYVHEGTMRSLYFKDGRRVDTAVYSRLAGDPWPNDGAA